MPNPRATGLPHPASYQIVARGVVLDKVTGLMWQREIAANHFSWSEATSTCDALDLAGYTDWRLPSRIELVSILDLTRSEPAIDLAAFPHTPTDWFWASSGGTGSGEATAWDVYFFFGHAKRDPVNSPFRARCVRKAAASPPAKGRGSGEEASALPYEIRQDVVLDRGSGLTWQRFVPARTLSHEGARKYCADLILDGAKKNRWRVPALGELLTLVDERASSPAIDIEAFPRTPAETFWTSSVFADTTAMAWSVDFEQGNTSHDIAKTSYRVRCVY